MGTDNQMLKKIAKNILSSSGEITGRLDKNDLILSDLSEMAELCLGYLMEISLGMREDRKMRTKTENDCSSGHGHMANEVTCPTSLSGQDESLEGFDSLRDLKVRLGLLKDKVAFLEHNLDKAREDATREANSRFMHFLLEMLGPSGGLEVRDHLTGDKQMSVEWIPQQISRARKLFGSDVETGYDERWKKPSQ